MSPVLKFLPQPNLWHCLCLEISRRLPKVLTPKTPLSQCCSSCLSDTVTQKSLANALTQALFEWCNARRAKKSNKQTNQRNNILVFVSTFLFEYYLPQAWVATRGLYMEAAATCKAIWSHINSCPECKYRLKNQRATIESIYMSWGIQWILFIHIMGVCVCGKDGKRPKLLIQDPQTGPDDFSWRGPWPSLSSLFLLTGRVTKVIVDQILSTPQSPPRKYLVLLKPFPTCWTSNTKHF